MDTALFVLLDTPISIRDLVLIAGGLFLLVKGTLEIHDSVEGRGEDEDIDTRPSAVFAWVIVQIAVRSEEHTSELQSLMRISYAVFCLKTNTKTILTLPHN